MTDRVGGCGHNQTHTMTHTTHTIIPRQRCPCNSRTITAIHAKYILLSKISLTNFLHVSISGYIPTRRRQDDEEKSDNWFGGQVSLLIWPIKSYKSVRPLIRLKQSPFEYPITAEHSPGEALVAVQVDVPCPRPGYRRIEVGGFSKAEYEDIAPFFGLDPCLTGTDIESFDLHLFYIPLEVFETVMDALQTAQYQYGPRNAIRNETGVASYISPVLSLCCQYLIFRSYLRCWGYFMEDLQKIRNSRCLEE